MHSVLERTYSRPRVCVVFHMLQTTCELCGAMLQWGQTIFDWKRIAVSKVCDAFNFCRKTLFLMVNDLDRLDWHAFLFECECDVKIKKQSNSHDNEFLFNLIDNHLNWLKIKGTKTNDERRKHMFYFALMGHHFRKFWHVMKRGDRAT